MTWVPLLLTDPSPNLRMLVLRELLHRGDEDPEIEELRGIREEDPLVQPLLKLQEADGSWRTLGDPGSRFVGPRRATIYALARLGYLGFGKDHPAVRRGAEYLFSLQGDDGSWAIEGYGEGKEEKGYTMIPLQTALPLRGLAACGFATDPRSERAYDWLLEHRLPDGAWPSGMASGNYGGVGGYRRIPHSRWGCRSNTTGALVCLSLHRKRRGGAEARRGLDLLLGRETKERHPMGFEVARLLGAERTGGIFTHYARFDLAQMLDLCWRLGASMEDDRVAAMVDFVKGAQGAYGLWDYVPSPQISRWVSFDLLRSLSQIDQAGEWISSEPRTPFRAYGKKIPRF